MPTFSNSPIPQEPAPRAPEGEATVHELTADEASAELSSPQEATSVQAHADGNSQENPSAAEASLTESPVHEPPSTASAVNQAVSPRPSEGHASVATAPKATPAFPQTPDDGVLIRNFSKAKPEAAEKLRHDFGLELDHHGFTRLQRLFRDILKREPTAGELRVLDALDRAGRGYPDREAVGELYTDSPHLAETWADMMDKHTRLHEAEGKRRIGDRPPPPCSFADAMTLLSRYLHRTGRVLPIPDGLPFGGKNTDGRTVVLADPAGEAEASAQGYTLAARVMPEDVMRSVWVRKGAAPETIPAKTGDFLVLLPSATRESIQALLAAEQTRSHPLIGDIRALANRSVLEAVLTLCEGAELYTDRLPREDDTTPPGRIAVQPLCGRPVLSEGRPCGYLLRVPVRKVRELSELFRENSVQAIAIGQVKGNGRITFRIRIGNQDVTVGQLPHHALTRFPVIGLYRRHAEAAIPTDRSIDALPDARLWRVPEAGLLMAASSVTVTDRGQGYTTAIGAVEAAMAPLRRLDIPAHALRLSVALTAADGEQAPGDLSVEVICGLYRIAAESGISMDDPSMTILSYAKDTPPSVTLSVAAWAGHPASLCDASIPTAPVPPTPLEAVSPQSNTKGIEIMHHIFEPLCQKPRSVILDTDIGPDCDDVGALVCLIDYAKKYGFPIAGICNCTSNKAGTGAIDAVCRHCGIETPYLGQWSKPDFMDDPSCHKYNDAVAEKFSEDYRNGTLKTADEVTFYRTLLAAAEDDSVMVITIGMFNNLAALLQSGADEISPLSGLELVKAKVNCLVSMAAILPEGRECNVISDYKAAEVVFKEWPTAVYLSDFHIGWKIMTGYEHIQDPEAIESHPLVMAYHLYTKDWTHLPLKGMNSSYDLTAIQFAAEGEGALYSLLEPVDLEFYAAIPERPELADATRAIPNPHGKFRFMKKEASDEVIRDSLNEILRRY